MNFNELQRAADQALYESLSSAGFRNTVLGTWNRRRGQELNVVQLQEHSVSKMFCVNLGVHYGFLPKAGTEAPVHGDQIELPDCELKLRLTDQPAAKDQWWPISEESINQVVDLMAARGLTRKFHPRSKKLAKSPR